MAKNIYISVDCEGMAGIYNWDLESQEQAIFRSLYNKHVLWVLEGIQKSGAQVERILISDSHAKGNNLDLELLNEFEPRVELIQGLPRRDYMMTGLDNSFSDVFLIGYHAGVGASAANMDHTYSGSTIYNLTINGVRVNETTINSLFAGELNVPVSLVVGDDALCTELKTMMPGVTTVATKHSLTKSATHNYPLVQVKKNIVGAVKKVLSTNEQQPFQNIKSPYTVTIDTTTTVKADAICYMPAIKRITGRTIEFSADNMADVTNQIMAIVEIGARY